MDDAFAQVALKINLNAGYKRKIDRFPALGYTKMLWAMVHIDEITLIWSIILSTAFEAAQKLSEFGVLHGSCLIPPTNGESFDQINSTICFLNGINKIMVNHGIMFIIYALHEQKFAMPACTIMPSTWPYSLRTV